MFAASSRTSHSEVRTICSNEDDLTEKADGERGRENLINRILVKQFSSFNIWNIYLFYGIELFL